MVFVAWRVGVGDRYGPVAVRGAIATMYAAEHPVRGVVNVDQPLRVEPFAQLVESVRDRLDSPAFPQVWQMFRDSMGIEKLAGDAQQLLRTSSRPRRELIVSYWRDLLETPPEELAALMDAALTRIRTLRTPYAFVLGRQLEPPDEAWLSERLPQATITILPGSGHFPQLGDQQRFAQILVATCND
jgi:pimeloyl-ACP methyl ester carboxylesterase